VRLGASQIRLRRDWDRRPHQLQDPVQDQPSGEAEVSGEGSPSSVLLAVARTRMSWTLDR
jgi:hypothetical protein